MRPGGLSRALEATNLTSSPELRYRAVLLDLDGTLIDSAVDLVGSLQYALRQIDDREPPEASDVLCLIGKPLEQILRELGYPTDDVTTGKFITVYRERYAEHFNDHTLLYPEVLETLQALQHAGTRTAVVTTKLQAQADFTTREFGLRPYLDYVQGHQEGLRHKPDPEPVQLALTALGIPPADAIMVGDAELDLEAGRTAGTATCAVTYGFRPPWFLRTYRPDFMIARIADLIPIVVKLPWR